MNEAPLQTLNSIERESKEARAYAEAPNLDVLDNHEMEVLVEIAEGLGNEEIAIHLGLDPRRVQAQRERLMRKLRIAESPI